MTFEDIVSLAESHVNDNVHFSKSAALMLTEARKLYNQNHVTAAMDRAAHSIFYSCGLFHEDYKKVKMYIL
jgi:hypothetical protein